MGSVMFCDLNEGATSFQRNFTAQMKQCDDVDRCLRFISNEVNKAGIPVGGIADDDAERSGGGGGGSSSSSSYGDGGSGGGGGGGGGRPPSSGCPPSLPT